MSAASKRPDTYHKGQGKSGPVTFALWPYGSRGPPAFGALALQDVGDELRASQVNCCKNGGSLVTKPSG